MKGIIIQESARNNGNTALIAGNIQAITGFEIVHLCDQKIAHFDYEFKNQDDDFPKLIRKIANEFDVVILITPIYWYTMSGMMKVFFDRISDCLKIDKETGRKLRRKYMVAISSSEDDQEYEGFFMPFKQSAKYLGMKYLGNIHVWIDTNSVPELVKNRINIFLEKLNLTG